MNTTPIMDDVDALRADMERLRASITELESAAKYVDGAMGGNEQYEHMWANFPELPAIPPAKALRRVIKQSLEGGEA